MLRILPVISGNVGLLSGQKYGQDSRTFTMDKRPIQARVARALK